MREWKDENEIRLKQRTSFRRNNKFVKINYNISMKWELERDYTVCHPIVQATLTLTCRHGVSCRRFSTFSFVLSVSWECRSFVLPLKSLKLHFSFSTKPTERCRSCVCVAEKNLGMIFYIWLAINKSGWAELSSIYCHHGRFATRFFVCNWQLIPLTVQHEHHSFKIYRHLFELRVAR